MGGFWTVARFRATAVCWAALTLPAAAQTAQDRTWCVTDGTTSQQTIRGCTNLILSRKFEGAELAKFFSFRAWAYGTENDLDRALADYADAIRIEPNAPRYAARGKIYERKSELDRAMADLDEALRLDSKYAPGYLNRASVWDEKNDSQNALKDIADALRLDPKMAGAYFLRAFVFRKMHDFAHAVADYDEAIRLAPNSFYYRNARNGYVQSAHMDEHWTRYLREIQNEGDYANWNGPPLNAQSAAKP
jgi:tetratricopeptide (TPR) repeat protein